MKKLLFIAIIFIGCKKEVPSSTKSSPERIVLIAQNTPTNFSHLIKVDSIGKKVKDATLGENIREEKNIEKTKIIIRRKLVTHSSKC